MCQQPVDPIRAHSELRVVEIVGVNGRAVGERREARRHPHGGPENRRRTAQIHR